jgi:hypothetical protein
MEAGAWGIGEWRMARQEVRSQNDNEAPAHLQWNLEAHQQAAGPDPIHPNLPYPCQHALALGNVM